MRAIGKGLLVVAITIILFGIFVGQAWAGTERELMKLLEGKRTIYVGTCHLNKAGMFRDGEKEYTVHRCIIGVDDREKEERYYGLIVDGQGNGLKLYLIDKSVKPVKQEVLWTKGTML